MAMKITRETHFKIAQARDDGFMQGYAVALVILSGEPDGPEMARRTLKNGGFKLSDFWGKGVGKADYLCLKELFRPATPEQKEK